MPHAPSSTRRALVCGASQGIGREIALELAHVGFRVVALARREDALTALMQDMEGTGHKMLACDINDHALLRAQIEEQLRDGPLHVLVCNSAGPKPEPLLESTPETLLAAFTQHIVSNQLLAQLLVPGMKQAMFGRIITITSTSVRSIIPNLGASNIVRAAVANWVKTLAFELAPLGITVNNIMPGYTATPRLKILQETQAQRQNRSVDEVSSQWLAKVPMQRFAHPREIAYLVKHLASEESNYITGTDIPVDGGRLLS